MNIIKSMLFLGIINMSNTPIFAAARVQPLDPEIEAYLRNQMSPLNLDGSFSEPPEIDFPPSPSKEDNNYATREDITKIDTPLKSSDKLDLQAKEDQKKASCGETTLSSVSGITTGTNT